MVSPISAAMQAATAATRAVRGVTITYRRGSTDVEVVAVRGSTKWDVEQIDNGAHASERSVDWIITVDDLTQDDGTVLTPQRADEVIDENGVTYRVMPFGPDEQLWRWHDRESQTVYRIHTKERR